MSSQSQPVIAVDPGISNNEQSFNVEILKAESSQVDTPKKRVIGRPFEKGNKANPLGRPSTRFVSEHLRELLAQGYDKKIAKRLITIAANTKNEKNALVASDMVMDRTEGKPVQAMVIQQGIDDRTADRLADIADKLGLLADSTSR